MSTVEYDSSGPLVVNWESGLIGILKAGEDLSTDFGFVVEQSTTAALTVLKTTGASSRVVGVTYTKRASGRKVGVCNRGIVVAITSVAITVGDRLQSAAGGKIATWAGTNAHEIIGIALEAATAADQRIKILLQVS